MDSATEKEIKTGVSSVIEGLLSPAIIESSTFIPYLDSELGFSLMDLLSFPEVQEIIKKYSASNNGNAVSRLTESTLTELFNSLPYIKNQDSTNVKKANQKSKYKVIINDHVKVYVLFNLPSHWKREEVVKFVSIEDLECQITKKGFFWILCTQNNKTQKTIERVLNESKEEESQMKISFEVSDKASIMRTIAKKTQLYEYQREIKGLKGNESKDMSSFTAYNINANNSNSKDKGNLNTNNVNGNKIRRESYASVSSSNTGEMSWRKKSENVTYSSNNNTISNINKGNSGGNDQNNFKRSRFYSEYDNDVNEKGKHFGIKTKYNGLPRERLNSELENINKPEITKDKVSYPLEIKKSYTLKEMISFYESTCFSSQIPDSEKSKEFFISVISEQPRELSMLSQNKLRKSSDNFKRNRAYTENTNIFNSKNIGNNAFENKERNLNKVIDYKESGCTEEKGIKTNGQSIEDSKGKAESNGVEFVSKNKEQKPTENISNGFNYQIFK